MRVPLLLTLTLLGCATTTAPPSHDLAPGPAAAAATAATVSRGIPDAAVPNGLGVEIHFVDPPSRDIQMIAEAGFRFVRMDFTWAEIERQKGSYDFAAYERLVDALAARGIRPLFILDYGNPHYDSGLAPQTDEGRQAFARFAAAGAARFKGRGVIWELWNEPNSAFWKPRPSADDYMALAKATLPAVRQADPNATIIAPAAAVLDLRFLEHCFEQGLLELVDGVSVHPYGRVPPESVADDYQRLRVLISRYAPKGKEAMPILSGEWGFSGTWFSREQQAQFLAREFLTNLLNGVPLSIWYDWHDDGPNPKEQEHNYGTVTQDYQLKPAYHAARTLIQELNGYRFVKRLPLSSADDYAALFTKNGEQKLVLWTTAGPHAVTLPVDVRSGAIVQMTGERGRMRSPDTGLTVEISGSPQYVTPGRSSTDLEVAGAWSVESAPAFNAGVPASDPGAPRLTVVVSNPTDAALTGSVEARIPAEIEGRWVGGSRFSVAPRRTARLVWEGSFPRREERTFRVPVTLKIEGRPQPMRQEIAWAVRNPLRVRPSLGTSGAPLEVENPSGEPFEGVLALSTGSGGRVVKQPLRLARGERRKALDPSPVAAASAGATSRRPSTEQTFRGSLLSRDEAETVATVAPVTIRTVESFESSRADGAYQAALDGDPKVPAKAETRVTRAPEGGPPRALRVEYDLGAGWRFWRLTPTQPMSIAGQPKGVRMRIYNARASGDAIHCRVVDATGKTFQPTAREKLTWQGWRWVTMPLDDPNIEHWGGGNQEKIQYPLRWDSLLVVDSPGNSHTGTLYIADVMLLYEGETP